MIGLLKCLYIKKDTSTFVSLTRRSIDTDEECPFTQLTFEGRRFLNLTAQRVGTVEVTECQRRGGGRQRGGRFQRQDSSGSVVISAASHYTDPAEDIIDVLFRYRDSTGTYSHEF